MQLGQLHDGNFDESRIAPQLGNLRTRLRLVANHLGVLSGGPRNFNRVRHFNRLPQGHNTNNATAFTQYKCASYIENKLLLEL